MHGGRMMRIGGAFVKEGVSSRYLEIGRYCEMRASFYLIAPEEDG